MEKEEKKVKLTQEEANEFVCNRADELSKSMGITILPLLFEYGDEWIYGYFKTPTRFQIMDIVGKAGQQILFSGEKLLQTNLLVEESDKRLLNDNPAFDEINVGAFIEAYRSSNKVSYNLAEKKSTK